LIDIETFINATALGFISKGSVCLGNMAYNHWQGSETLLFDLTFLVSLSVQVSS
jgi:hypothetical protein